MHTWIERPALSRVAITSPVLWRAFARDSEIRRYREIIKPFGFALSAHVAPLGHPVTADTSRFHLIAPYERDNRRWGALPWRDVHSGEYFAISTMLSQAEGVVRVQSFRHVFERFRSHPEPKSADAEGRPCLRHTCGLLQRRHAHVDAIKYVGKETNQLEEVEAGMVHNWSAVLPTADDAADEWSRSLLGKLRSMSRREAAKALGISERAVSSLRNGKSRPSRRTLALLQMT